MMITAVSMRVINREKVRAFASITLDDEFVVHDLRIIEGQKGLFVAMPSRKLPNGEFRDVAHPIKPDVRDAMQIAILDEYDRCLAESGEPVVLTENAEEGRMPAMAG